MSQTHKKTKLIALVLAGLIFLNVNFVSAAVNQTLKDGLLPFVDIKYDYVNGIIDEVMIYNRTLASAEIGEIYSASPHASGEIWNCTINATDSQGMAGNPNSTTITISAPADTCSYSSGTWNVNCADNCIISTEVNMNGNYLFIQGNGLFTLNADIKKYGMLFVNGNCGIIQGLGRFKE